MRDMLSFIGIAEIPTSVNTLIVERLCLYPLDAAFNCMLDIGISVSV